MILATEKLNVVVALVEVEIEVSAALRAFQIARKHAVSFANEYEDDFIKAMMGRSAKVTENERARKQRAHTSMWSISSATMRWVISVALV